MGVVYLISQSRKVQICWENEQPELCLGQVLKKPKMDQNKWSRLVNQFLSSDYKVSREWKKGVVKTGTGFLANWHLYFAPSTGFKALLLRKYAYLFDHQYRWMKQDWKTRNQLIRIWILLNKALKHDDLPEYLASKYFFKSEGI